LGTLSGITSFVLAINDSGQVTGYTDTLGNTAYHATIWNGNTLTDLGTQFKGYSFAYGINNFGQLAGLGTFTPYSEDHAIIWNGITPADLVTQVVGYFSYATAINDSSQVVGIGYSHHATIWNGNTATDLGTLPGRIYSEAAAINNSGQVVGYSWTTDTDSTAYHATIWNGNTLTDLNDPLNVGAVMNSVAMTRSPSFSRSFSSTRIAILPTMKSIASAVNAGWVLLQANGINDNGWIVGNAFNSVLDERHGFLLTPCDTCPINIVQEVPHIPEPETYALFMAGLGLLMGFIARRRKNDQA
jgi:probable HAF family extracellular repeat protein